MAVVFDDVDELGGELDVVVEFFLVELKFLAGDVVVHFDVFFNSPFVDQTGALGLLLVKQQIILNLQINLLRPRTIILQLFLHLVQKLPFIHFYILQQPLLNLHHINFKHSNIHLIGQTGVKQLLLLV